MNKRSVAPIQINPALLWLKSWLLAWERFWFAARKPDSLAVIRICCGAMLTYVHVIWAFVVNDFMGPYAWIDQTSINELHRDDWAWSWLWYVDSPSLLFLHELVAILACACMTLGLFTRVSTILAWWLTLMVCHRMTLALFGLDQIVIMLSMYLMISSAGSTLSLDSRIFRDRASSWWFPSAEASVSNNVATRLIQLHLCVIYVFGGLSKMRGEMWYDGSAMWYTIVNYEYQSANLVWLGKSQLMIGLLTGMTIFWETFYIALVWPKLTRPLAVGIAVFVHGGIALGLGMVTFGVIMIVANFAFIEPEFMRNLLIRLESLSPWSKKSRVERA